MRNDRTRAGRWASASLLAVAGLGCGAGPGLAHGAESAIVLLLPTGYYLGAASVAVAATFLLVALLPPGAAAARFRPSLRVAVVPRILAAIPSLASLALLAVLVSAGVLGSRDPLHNPLPAFVWTFWWVVLTLAHAVFGPLWRLVNPWTGALAALRAVTRTHIGREPLVRLPQQIGYAIAFAQFYVFAWFELVDLAPSDPDRLAWAVTVYVLANLVGMAVFGEEDWAGRCEPFSIFLGLVGALAPLAWTPKEGGHVLVTLAVPGRHLVDRAPLRPSGVLFVLLTLATVSFDGLSRTFAWLSAIGVNPLEFPGRSEVVEASTLGILATFAVLAILFFGSIALGLAWTGAGSDLPEAAGRLVYAVLPIAVAFQFAHYLTSVLVEMQNMLSGITDPYGRGWDLIGTAGYHVTTSFLYDFDQVRLIFLSQTLAIAGGHVLAVLIAHAILARLLGARAKTFVAELPFAVLMVGYTAFGLWLLSTARV